MSAIAVIGSWERVRGWVLSGATVHEVGSADEVRSAWRDLGPDVAVVVLTERAAQDLADERATRTFPLVAVIPS